MSAGQYDVVIEQGADLVLAFRWFDGDGVQVALSGYTAQMQARKFATASAVLFDFTPYLTISGDEVQLSVPAAATAAIDWVSGRYDLELTDPLGGVTRLIEGTVTVSPEVTRGV